MLKFKKLKNNINTVCKYFDKSTIKICDLTSGVRFMWDEMFKIEYAIVNDTLILKESNPLIDNLFYYPIGSDVETAIKEIEKYTQKRNLPLAFGYLDTDKTKILSDRYCNVDVTYDRSWSDYVYLSGTFLTYSGKKLSGQRNHVNKFEKTYNNYRFVNLDTINEKDVFNFINKCETNIDESQSAITEKHNLIKYVKNYKKLNQVGGALIVDSKIIAISVGEIVGDTMYIHVEKALKEYVGAYPMMAKCFANAFCKNVKFINREEDCGDMGLRTSKMQYHPIEIKNKYLLKVTTLFDKITPPVYLTAGDLAVTDITRADRYDYRRLYIDEKLNRFWGYDYKKDLKGQNPDADYFYNFMQGLKDKKEEYSFALRFKGKFIGELVLHNFDYYGGVEVGFRVLKEYQRKGYAYYGVTALIDYAKNTLNAKIIKAKCYKQNIPSLNLLKKLGFTLCSADKTYYYFSL